MVEIPLSRLVPLQQLIYARHTGCVLLLVLGMVVSLLKWNEPRQWDLNQPITVGNLNYKHFEVERMYKYL
jgi:hypothetical protein